MQLRLWLKRVRLRWDRAVLTKTGVWGNTAETLEFLLDHLTSEHLALITLPSLKRTRLTTLTGNVDHLLQIVIRARWIMQAQDTAVSESIQKFATFDRTLDDYLLTVNETPIRPQEAVELLRQELPLFLNCFRMMLSEGNIKLDYYRRQYEWLFGELRELLQALVRAGDNKISF